MSDEPRQVVRPPEQVVLHLPVAGPASRMLAYAIDYVVLLTLQIGVALLVFLAVPVVAEAVGGRIRGAITGDDVGEIASSVFWASFGILLVLHLVVELGYFLLCETTTGGRSLGKAVVGLRVVRDGGFPVGLRESLIRNLLRTVDELPGTYLVGLIATLLSPDGKRLGDLAAGTLVVRLDRPVAAAPLGAEPEGIGRFRFAHAQLASLGRPELALVRETLRRVDELPPERAGEALARAVEALRARMGYEPVAPEEHAAFLRALLAAVRSR